MDDHGDQFPGAVPPAGTSVPRPGAGDAFPRMNTAGMHEGGRPRLSADTRLRRMGEFTRRSLDRFDRYTLDVFNAGSPARPQR